MLLAVLSALAAPAAAQLSPNPCHALRQAYAVKWCVAREASLMDAVYVAAARATNASYPAPQRDSVAALELAWLEQHNLAVAQEADPLQQLSRNLVGKRRQLFRLRHQILSLAAASDPARMRIIPVYQAWTGTQSDRGLTLTLNNGTDQSTDFIVRLYDPESDRLEERSVRIQPRGNIRISWIERWEWHPGMQLQLLHPLYAPVLSEAPLPDGG